MGEYYTVESDGRYVIISFSKKISVTLPSGRNETFKEIKFSKVDPKIVVFKQNGKLDGFFLKVSDVSKLVFHDEDDKNTFIKALSNKTSNNSMQFTKSVKDYLALRQAGAAR